MLLYSLIFLLSIIGSRLNSAGFGEAVTRGVQLLDIIIFLSIPFLMNNNYSIKVRLPSTVLKYYICYIALFPTALSPLIYSFYGYSYWLISPFFFIREIMTIIAFEYSAKISSKLPVYVLRFSYVSIYLVSLWIIKELFFPTGFYYIGLPFESGPSQTGLVLSLFGCYSFLVAFDPRVVDISNHYLGSNSYTSLSSALLKISFFIIAAGVFSSLSRTGIASFVSSFVIYALLTPVRSKKSIVRLLILFLVIIFLTLAISKADFITPFLARWFHFSDSASDRGDKVALMVGYQIRDLYGLFLGFGFDSPNQHVLGRDLGSILAVDNGYFRRIFELGLIGACFYSFFLVGIYRALSPVVGGKITAMFFSVLLVSSFAIESFQVFQVSVLFFVLMGTLFGLFSSIEQSSKLFKPPKMAIANAEG